MFSSVKNWLTLLIVALVALAMLVAWVYVIPPLQGRLTDQKLAEARSNAQLLSNTLAPSLGYDSVAQQATIRDADTLDATLSLLSSRFSGTRADLHAQPGPARLLQPTSRPRRTSATTRCWARPSGPACRPRGR